MHSFEASSVPLQIFSLYILIYPGCNEIYSKLKNENKIQNEIIQMKMMKKNKQEINSYIS